MQSKRIKVLSLVLIISLGYSWLSLLLFERDIGSDQPNENEQSITVLPQNNNGYMDPISNASGRHSKPFPAVKAKASGNSQNNNDNIHANDLSLPVAFLLLGTKPKTADEPAQAIIEFEGNLIEFQENALMLNYPMRLITIHKNSIDIEYDEQLFSVELLPPNLLGPNYKKLEKSKAELLQMSASEIGYRPRIIEHLITLTHTPYIADGKLVSPGINPTLFHAAGFQVDDVLKKVNGRSVTVEHELEDIQKDLKTAHTLKFEVMRRGRIITLYLDIPSEGLKISAG